MRKKPRLMFTMCSITNLDNYFLFFSEWLPLLVLMRWSSNSPFLSSPSPTVLFATWPRTVSEIFENWFFNRELIFKFVAVLNKYKIPQDKLKILEIENDPDCGEIQDHMLKITGGRTVRSNFLKLENWAFTTNNIFRFHECLSKENASVGEAKPLLPTVLAIWRKNSKPLVPSKCFIETTWNLPWKICNKKVQ